jgi:hypothetical protein
MRQVLNELTTISKTAHAFSISRVLSKFLFEFYINLFGQVLWNHNGFMYSEG